MEDSSRIVYSRYSYMTPLINYRTVGRHSKYCIIIPWKGCSKMFHSRKSWYLWTHYNVSSNFTCPRFSLRVEKLHCCFPINRKYTIQESFSVAHRYANIRPIGYRWMEEWKLSIFFRWHFPSVTHVTYLLWWSFFHPLSIEPPHGIDSDKKLPMSWNKQRSKRFKNGCALVAGRRRHHRWVVEPRAQDTDGMQPSINVTFGLQQDPRPSPILLPTTQRFKFLLCLDLGFSFFHPCLSGPVRRSQF